MEIRVIAVDWSGRKQSARRRIWLAESACGDVRRLQDGRDREELAAHLVEEAEGDRHLVVGLDFAFSFPEWFYRHVGVRTVHQL